jgi:hypothetical protein
MAEQILVSFEGDGSGVEELTWGQLEIWPAMQLQRSSFSIGGWLPVPPGRSIDDIADDLRFVMSRHSSLRTRLQFETDGSPRQVLARSGEISLRLIDAGDEDPEEVAAALHQRWTQQVFDYAREWPIRWAVILRQGVPAYLVSVICHVASDGEGVVAMLQDLAARDPQTGRAKGPVTAIQPLEQARLQRTPAVLRTGDAALAHCERLLRAMPARRFCDPADQQRPRYRQVFYDSAASHLAIQAIAARTGVNTSTVLLAAWAVALARVTGSNPSGVQVIVNNRFRRGFAEAVSPLCHASLCVIDVADATFDEAVARTWRSAMAAYKNAYYDPLRRAELIERVGRERGEEIDLACMVNDRRMQSRQEPASQPPGPREVEAARQQSLLTWGYQKDEPGEQCFLHINNVPGTLQYELLADTHFLSPAGMEAALRGAEAVVVQAALDPSAPTGIRSALLRP